MRAQQACSFAVLVLSALGAACSGDLHSHSDAASDGAAVVQSLHAVSVDWNSAGLALGHIQAVTEATVPNMGSFVIVFGDQGAQVIRGGSVFNGDSSVTAWTSAAVITAADATGSWPVGVDQMGRVMRLRALATLEDISARYGLTGVHVRMASQVTPTVTAFAFDGGIALADGMTVTRFDDPAFADGFAAGSGRVAGIANGMARVYNAAMPSMPQIVAYAVPGAAFITSDSSGHIVVATEHALFVEDEMLHLRPTYTTSASIHGLTTSASRVWFAVGTELGTIEGGVVSVSTGMSLPADGTLVGSVSGDVWLLQRGTLSRYGIPGDPDETYWQTNVLPIYSRVCRDCHAPNNQVSHVDLSAYDQWRIRRVDIHRRVIELAGTADAARMPPMNGTPLTAAEMATIGAWSSNGVSDGGVSDAW